MIQPELERFLRGAGFIRPNEFIRIPETFMLAVDVGTEAFTEERLVCTVL